MNRKIAVILINYRDYANRFLADCYASLRKQTYPESFYKIVIVDNESTPASREFLRLVAPEAVLIFNDNNDGFAKANNDGFNWAKANGCDYVVSLNMDTVVEPSWLEELAESAAVHPEVGAIQSKILLWSSKKINSLGNELHFLGFGFCSSYSREDNQDFSSVKEITYASGAAVLFKLEALEKVGQFDENFFMYHEDSDLSWRIRLAGYKIILAPKSVAHHKYEFNRSARLAYYIERNRLILMFKNYHWPTLLLISPALIFMELGILGYALVSGNFVAKIKVYAYFLNPRNLFKLFNLRREVQKRRLIKDRELIGSFLGTIDFQEIYNPVIKYLVNPIFNLYWRIIKKLIVW